MVAQPHVRRYFQAVPEKSRLSRVILRYILFNLPVLGLVVIGLILLRRWFDLAEWMFWAVIVGWVIKDTLLFPLVKTAYDDRAGYSYSPVGERAVVQVSPWDDDDRNPGGNGRLNKMA
jgi:hypothetical protein